MRKGVLVIKKGQKNILSVTVEMFIPYEGLKASEITSSMVFT